jgi:hypothetical protein
MAHLVQPGGRDSRGGSQAPRRNSSRLLERLLHRIARWRPKLHRLRLVGLTTTVRILVAAACGAIAVVAVMAVMNWSGPAVGVSIPASDVSFTYRPVLLEVTLLAGGLGVACLGAAAGRSAFYTRLGLSGLVCCGALLALSQVRLLQTAGVPLAAAGCFCTIAGLLVPARRGSTWQAVQALLLGFPYALGAVVVGLESGAATPSLQTASLLGGLQVELVAACRVAVPVLVTIWAAQGLWSRHERAIPFALRPMPTWALVTLVSVKILYLAIRYRGVGGKYFGDAEMWVSRSHSPLTWLHALLVALAISWLALGSHRYPLPASGRSLSLAVLVGALILPDVLMLLGFVGNVVGGLLLPGTGQAALTLGAWAIAYFQLILLGAVIVATVGALAWVSFTRRLQAGIVLILFMALWVLPFTTGFVLLSSGRDVPTFWALPQQVDVFLTVGVVAALLMRRRWEIPKPVLARLIVVPTALIYVLTVLPADWASRWWRLLLVIGVLVPLLARAPMVAADPRRQDRVVLGLVGGQLTVLVAFYLAFSSADAAPANLGTPTILAKLWLAVPAVGLLCANLSTAPADLDLRRRQRHWWQPRTHRALPLP